ncbi:hypothetical protein FS749_013652 [Ceratobasidium sp. UAMH 11750]|nr:hypothetical protein FS749_013652 [Ceratobasidium sp. UAMH 11750]
MSSVLKRKAPATSESSSEHNKWSRESPAAPDADASRLSSVSIPETVLESELESAVPPAHTPQNCSLAQEEPATPTPNAPPSALVIAKTTNDQASVTPPPPTTPPQVPSEAISAAPANPGITPLRLSSSNTDPNSVDPTSSWSRRHPNAPSNPSCNQRSSQAIESNKMTKIDREEIGEILKYELCGNVYQHDKFFDEFIQSDPLVREDVARRIRSSEDFKQTSLLGYANGRWTIDPKIARQRAEKEVYGPLAEMLNVIGQAAYAKYRALFPDEQFRQRYHPFRDHDTRYTLWDSPSDTSIRPDLVMAPMSARTHWGDIELVIECKSNSDLTSWSDAYLQLARYACATFAHQIYQLHVLGFSLCGSIVNFVCFDRSGLLHSPDIDLSQQEGANSFVKHMIDLLTLRPDKFGYDTRFSFRREAGQNTVQTLFKFKDFEPRVVSELLWTSDVRVRSRGRRAEEHLASGGPTRRRRDTVRV